MDELSIELRGLANKFHKGFLGLLTRPLHRLTDKLIADNFVANPFSVGDTLPDKVLMNHLGKQIRIYEELGENTTIVSFYRGTWCPFCNAELRAYDQLFKRNNEKINLIAISPEQPDFSIRSTDVEKLKFKVFSDINNTYAKDLGLVYSLGTLEKFIYNILGMDIAKSQGNTGRELPIPVTYIIDKNKVIKYAWIDVDFSKRAEPSEVIRAYKEIERGGNDEV